MVIYEQIIIKKWLFSVYLLLKSSKSSLFLKIYNTPLGNKGEIKMNDIKVYTTSTCPYCVMVTNFLKEQNISFTEINVQENPEIMQKVVNETGQMGVPQSKVNGEWVLGFDPNKISSLLK